MTKTTSPLGQARKIPLNKLVPSKKNVRKTKPRGIADLVASIPVHGLLHPLQVEAGQGGTFEVVAGKRRLQALKALVKKRTIKATEPIPCRVVDPEAGREVSLVENFGREPMHGADEFDAWKQLHDDGLPVEDIAARFGVTKTVVLQRLKLAAISPGLMKRYRDGELSLEILMAFTLTDDHEAQENLWERLPSYQRDAATIKRILTEDEVPASSGRATFVGLEAYEEAGGAVRRDLFDEHGAYLTDPALLDRLVAEKLEAMKPEIEAEGWAWVETAPETDYSYLHLFKRIHPKTVPLTKADQKQVANLSADYDALAESEAVQDQDPEALAKLDALENEIVALEAKTKQYSKSQMAKAGVYVSLDSCGDLSIYRGLVKPSPKEARGEGGDDGEVGEGTPKKQKAPKEHSDKVLETLTAHETLALQATLAESPELAYDLLLAELVKAVYFASGWEPRSCFLFKLERPLFPKDTALGESKAHKAWHELHQRWALRLPQQAGEVLAYVREMQSDEKAALLAFCLSSAIDAVARPKDTSTERRGYADQLAEVLTLDMTIWWEATAASYFQNVRKDQILGAVAEARGQAAADNIAKMKKTDMAEAAEDRLAGTGWLPTPFRIGAHAPKPEDGEASEDPGVQPAS